MEELKSTKMNTVGEEILSVLCKSYDCVLEADTMEDVERKAIRCLPVWGGTGSGLWLELLCVDEKIRKGIREGNLQGHEIEEYVALYLAQLEERVLPKLESRVSGR